MKKVLIDLSVLKHINCGLGQIAYNYARFYGENAKNLDFEVHLLVPRPYIGAFGNDVHYHKTTNLYTMLPFLMPEYDVWHSIQQMSRFKPSRKYTKNVLTIHDINFIYEKKGQSLKKYTRKFLNRLNRADRVFCISNFTKTDVLSHFTTDKTLYVIYNGVEFGDTASAKKPVLPFADDKPFIFSIGQIRQKKNFHVLLDAMKLLPEYNLVIAGEKGTDYCNMIEQRIATEEINNVFLIGTIHNSEKIWLYNNCSAFVFPSLFEGFGLPVIEAMSYGKPVVSSDKTSLKEICAGRAFIMEDFEAGHIAETIREAIEAYRKDPSLALENQKYAKTFTYERHINEYIRIYRELLGI